MKHGFLIMTHLPPERIYAQVALLQSPVHYFFIHFDKKQAINENDAWYKKLKAADNVHILQERVNVQWGSFRIVQATVALIKAALQQPGISYLHLLSGECLHVKSVADISAFFTKNKGKEFIDHFLMPENAQHNLTYNRLNKFYLHEFFNPRSKNRKDALLKKVNDTLRKAQKLLKPAGFYRRYPASFPPVYAGAAWWSLSFGACKYIIDYIQEQPAFYKRFRYTMLPDEMFFQTILLNSPFSKNVINKNLRFVNFIGVTSNPSAVTMDNLTDISPENILIARKFTPDSKELLEHLQNNVYNNSSRA